MNAQQTATQIIECLRAGDMHAASEFATRLRLMVLADIPRQFRYTTKSGILTVYEGASAYYLVNNKTGNERCIGDGVDMIFDAEGCALAAGTVEFHEALALMVEYSEPEYLTWFFTELA